MREKFDYDKALQKVDEIFEELQQPGTSIKKLKEKTKEAGELIDRCKQELAAMEKELAEEEGEKNAD